MHPDVQETVTTADAARLLNVTRIGIQSAIARGRLHAVKHDGHWRVSIAEVERYRMFHLHSQSSDDAASNQSQRADGPRRKGMPPASE